MAAATDVGVDRPAAAIGLPVARPALAPGAARYRGGLWSLARRAGSAAIRLLAWTSRPRSGPAAPTRPSRPSRCRARRSSELLELARWAPNHHLTAPWRFRVVGPAALERLKEAAGPEGAAKLDRAPTLVVVSCRARRRPGPGRGGPARDRRRLLHRPARRPRPRARRLLAHARPAAHAPRAAPPSACPTRSASSACCTSATRARSRPAARAPRRRATIDRPSSTDADADPRRSNRGDRRPALRGAS